MDRKSKDKKKISSSSSQFKAKAPQPCLPQSSSMNKKETPRRMEKMKRYEERKMENAIRKFKSMEDKKHKNRNLYIEVVKYPNSNMWSSTESRGKVIQVKGKTVFSKNYANGKKLHLPPCGCCHWSTECIPFSPVLSTGFPGGFLRPATAIN